MEITEATTAKEINAFLKEHDKKTSTAEVTQELKLLRGKARRLKVIFNDKTTEDELSDLIAEAEDRIQFEKDQQKIYKENEKNAKEAHIKANIVLRNTDLVDMEQKDYFARDRKTGEVETAPAAFNKICGYPVEREELVAIFDSIFPKDRDFLFYKCYDKEVYLVIVPLKYAVTVQEHTEPDAGAFQRHALSFIGEGSVNPESLRSKLKVIYNHADIAKQPLA